MKILIRDYLATLREEKELEVLAADLLLNMSIEPVTKPQKGTRQHGVDISAVGPDPDNPEVKKLLLITIKAGPITRSLWDATETGVRASLIEILEVYLETRVDKYHQDLPKKIILCCGGELKAQVEDNWKGFKAKHSEPGKIQFDLWTGDKLAQFIQEYLLDEYLFSGATQSLMRKALATLDQNEQEPVFFYQLIEKALFGSDLPSDNSGKVTPKKAQRALSILSLCLGVIAKWALDVGNTRPALLCAERALLRTWDFLEKHQFLGRRFAQRAYKRLYEQYLSIGMAYAERIRPVCLVKDGLTRPATSDILEYPLRTFEAIGFLSTIGITQVCGYQAKHSESEQQHAKRTADLLAELIKNNCASGGPRYDSHANEIALGMLLLHMTGHEEEGVNWLMELSERVTWSFKNRRYFPVDKDRFEDLVALEFDQFVQPERFMQLSTLLPTVGEWIAIFAEQEQYAQFMEMVTNRCDGINLQLWYPDESTHSELYRKNAAFGTGSTVTSINLPQDINELRDTMRTRMEQQASLEQLPCFSHDFPALGLIASRHFRTPVIPAYWQELVPEE